MKFKELLDKADLSGAQLARRVGVSRAAVSAWCREDSAPSYDKLPEIANALNTSIDEIVKCFVKVTQTS